MERNSEIRETGIRVRVKLFATLSAYHPNSRPGIPFEIQIPEGTTVAELADRLRLPCKEVKVFFVNGRARPVDWPLRSGDEVGVFPPVGGG